MPPWSRSPEDALLMCQLLFSDPFQVAPRQRRGAIHWHLWSLPVSRSYCLLCLYRESPVFPFATRLTQRSGGSQWTSNPLADLRLGMLPDTLVHCNLYNGGRYNHRHPFCLCPRRRYRRNRDGDALRNLYVPASSSLLSTSCIQLTPT